MAEEESEEIINKSSEFDIDSELNSLVENKILPKGIADKLANKIKEKNINISKDQLHLLAEKVNEFINSYKDQLKQEQNNGNGSSKITDDVQSNEKIENHDLHELFDKINNLQQQIDALSSQSVPSSEHIEQTYDQSDKTLNENLTTGHDIKVPGFNGNTSVHDDMLVELPNDPESIIVVMNWLQYLIDRSGYENLSDILDYYVDIEWITDDVKISLIDYSRGIKQEKTTGSKNSSKKDINQLPSTSHIQSYMYIQKLKGRQFDKHFVDRVQSQLSRIKKKVDQFQENEIK